MENLLSSNNTHLGDAKVKHTILLISAICGLAVILLFSSTNYANSTSSFRGGLTDSVIPGGKPNVATEFQCSGNTCTCDNPVDCFEMGKAGVCKGPLQDGNKCTFSPK
jgi:hypothetical protein